MSLTHNPLLYRASVRDGDKYRRAGRACQAEHVRYDALVSINVPNDKARAVVDAMERDMATTIATKSDLQLLKQELMAAMSGLATRDELLAVKAEIAVLRQDNALIRKDMELLSTTMTVRLGSMLMIGLGLLFAALKLT